MTAVQPVSKTSHAAMRWTPYRDMSFATGDVFAPLVLAEVRRVALHLPIAFLQHESDVRPVVLQGLKAGQNLCLTPKGKWALPYIPSIYRGYPFSLPEAPDGRRILCFDHDSGLISETEGEAFFDDSGEPAPRLAEILRFLTVVAENREPTRLAANLLAQHSLLVPWRIDYQEQGQARAVEGVQQVDEAAFRELDAAALLELHEAGALNLIFCHLLSMPNVRKLQRLNELHAAAFDPEKDSIDELLGLPNEEVIEFGF
ncbi:MAG: hypothetical protein ACI87W_000785 [Halieaceae bacterium]|jgi:hypothetical protein